MMDIGIVISIGIKIFNDDITNPTTTENFNLQPVYVLEHIPDHQTAIKNIHNLLEKMISYNNPSI